MLGFKDKPSLAVYESISQHTFFRPLKLRTLPFLLSDLKKSKNYRKMTNLKYTCKHKTKLQLTNCFELARINCIFTKQAA